MSKNLVIPAPPLASVTRWSRLWVHPVFWLLYIASEYFANLIHLNPEEHRNFFRAIFLSLPVLIFSTYFIAWYVVPKYLQTNRWWIFFLWIVLVGVFVFIARVEWQHLVNQMNYGYSDRLPVSKMMKNIIRDYSIIALAVCVSIIADYRYKQLLNQRLYQSKAEAEIQLLKGQLHPHFLFNSLNNIYSLALVKSDRTAESILKLTELLDYLLYRASREKVTPREEVELLRNYFGLEKLRYDERLVLDLNFNLSDENMTVGPLILLPFAENCFKHGGIGPDGIFHVRLDLRTTEKELIFFLRNSKKKGPGIPSSGGLGLENIRKRLSYLYPNAHKLKILDAEDYFEVQLHIWFGSNDR